MCNQACSALAQLVNSKNTMKLNIPAAFQMKYSGQLPFLGFFQYTEECLVIQGDSIFLNE